MAQEWKTLGNDPVEKVAEGVWQVQGRLPRGGLRRTMTVVKNAAGELLVHSAVALPEAEMNALDAHGPVRFIVVPNGHHRIDVPRFHERYPDAKVYAPSGSKKRVEEVVPVDGTHEDFVADDRVSLGVLDGCGAREGYVLVRGSDGATLVLNDAVFNHEHMPGFFGLVFRMLGTTGEPKITSIFRWSAMKDKKALRASLEKLAATPDLRRIIVGHGKPIVDGAAETLQRLAATL